MRTRLLRGCASYLGEKRTPRSRILDLEPEPDQFGGLVWIGVQMRGLCERLDGTPQAGGDTPDGIACALATARRTS